MRVSQRGRAILRRISAHDAVQTFRPGDFLLTSSGEGMARLLGLATASKINHAAVIIDERGTVIEANPSFLRDGRAFRVSSVQHYLDAGKPCWIGYVEVREGSRQEVAGYALHLLRAKGSVSISGRLWLAAHTIFSTAPRSYLARLRGPAALRDFLERRSVVMRENLCYSSGELVARALERGGFIWEYDPALITPADIFHRYCQPGLVPAPQPAKGLRVVSKSLVAARTKSTVTSLVPYTPGSDHDRTAASPIPTANPTTDSGWQALLGIGVATAVGLACIGFLEELWRMTGRKA